LEKNPNDFEETKSEEHIKSSFEEGNEENEEKHVSKLSFFYFIYSQCSLAPTKASG